MKEWYTNTQQGPAKTELQFAIIRTRGKIGGEIYSIVDSVRFGELLESPDGKVPMERLKPAFDLSACLGKQAQEETRKDIEKRVAELEKSVQKERKCRASRKCRAKRLAPWVCSLRTAVKKREGWVKQELERAKRLDLPGSHHEAPMVQGRLAELESVKSKLEDVEEVYRRTAGRRMTKKACRRMTRGIVGVEDGDLPEYFREKL